MSRDGMKRCSPVSLHMLCVVTDTLTRTQASDRTITIISRNKFLTLESISDIAFVTFAFIGEGFVIWDTSPKGVAFVIDAWVIGATEITFASIQTSFICEARK
jgi:hypothetical protein